jgi:hypothetical protein
MKVRLDQIQSSPDHSEKQLALVKIQEKEEHDNLQKEILHFLRAQVTAPSTRVEINQVNDLWEGRSPYHYDRE